MIERMTSSVDRAKGSVLDSPAHAATFATCGVPGNARRAMTLVEINRALA